MSGVRPPPEPSIRVDLFAERLWCGTTAVDLRPKTWAVLRHLVERPGVLVTKDELLDAVWADTAVSEGTLNKSIGELRIALGDDSRKPRFIATVARRGFRWIGSAETVPIAGEPKTAATSPPAVSSRGSADDLVGRAGELAFLEERLALAAAGERQIVFVTGEAGAGKTALVDAFLGRTADGSWPTRIDGTRGQCIESYGQHEPYMPVLEAIERLGRGPDGDRVRAALHRHAPTWLRQLPSLADHGAPQMSVNDVTPTRMLRELAVALEEITSTQPLILLIEDVHWADLATTDLCNLLARRRDPARLLVLLTLRAADAIVLDHPILSVKVELVHRQLAAELPVGLLPEAAVDEYLAARFPGERFGGGLARWIHHQTGGNPFFVGAVVEDLLARGALVEGDSGWVLRGAAADWRRAVPDSLRQVIEGQLARLGTKELAVAEAASVVGGELCAHAIAPALEMNVEDVEDHLDRLARQRRLLLCGGEESWPDGSRGMSFGFVHAIYQQVLYDRIPAQRRRRFHQSVAERVERGFAARPEDVAAQLAVHFEHAGDAARGLKYLHAVAAVAIGRGAPRDAVAVMEKAVGLIERAPALPDRDPELLFAMQTLASSRQLAFGYVDAELVPLLEKARALGERLGAAPQLFLSTAGLFGALHVGARHEAAAGLAQRLVELAEMFGFSAMLRVAYGCAGIVRYRMGELEEARGLLEKSLEYDIDRSLGAGPDFRATALVTLAYVMGQLGHPDRARRLALDALEQGRRSSAYDESCMLAFAVGAFAVFRDSEGVRERIDRALDLMIQHGFTGWVECARFLRGWSLLDGDQTDEGFEEMRGAIERQKASGHLVDRSALFCLYVQELLRCRRPGAGEALDEALAFVEDSGERYTEPELHRLRGELLLADGGNDTSEVESCFRRALDLARRRQARWYELLAASSLARLLHGQQRDAEARADLQLICDWFTEGEDLAELRRARALLAELG